MRRAFPLPPVFAPEGERSPVFSVSWPGAASREHPMSEPISPPADAVDVPAQRPAEQAADPDRLEELKQEFLNDWSIRQGGRLFYATGAPPGSYSRTLFAPTVDGLRAQLRKVMEAAGQKGGDRRGAGERR